MTSATIDPDQLDRFVRALFQHASEGGFVSIRAFYDDDLARKSNEGPFKQRTVRLNGQGLEPVIRSATQMAEEAAEARRPVVVCPPLATFKSGKASEANLLEGLVLSVEIDERAQDAAAKLRAVIGPPTLLVESGGLWTDPETGEIQAKLHWHSRLNEPTQAEEEHRRLKYARSLACDFVGADASSKPAVHPIRWAGTLHRKNPDAPRLARIVEENPDSEISLADVISELEGLVALHNEGQSTEHAAQQGDPTGDPDLLMQCAHRIENADLEWAAWNRLGMAFWRASEGSEAGFAAFDALSRKSEKYDPKATRARWDHYAGSPPERLSAATLVYEARKTDPEFRMRKPEDSAPAVTGDALFDTSHDGLALDMGRAWTDARHVALWGHWLFWAGSCWQRDERLFHLTRSREFLRTKGDELVRWAQQQNDPKLVETCEAIAKQLRSAQMVANVVGLARSNPEQVATVEQWDANPFELGAPKPGRNTP